MSQNDEKVNATGLDKFLSVVKLKWLREVVFNVGGRKFIVGGGALAVIDRIVQAAGQSFDWPHGIACLSVALVAGFVVFSTALEDSKKEKKA